MSAPMAAHAAREFFHRLKLWPADQFEELLTRTYSRVLQPGDVVIDVGAHTGRHSRVFAGLVGGGGKVYAFEPLPEIYALLQNDLGSVSCMAMENIAIGDVDGAVTFNHAEGVPGESGLRRRVRYDLPNVSIQEINVNCRRLDSLFPQLGSLRYIKIDVEGAELSVLSGGAGLIARLRPLISVEWGSDAYLSFGHQAASLYDFAMTIGYTIVDLFGNPVLCRSSWLDVSDVASWDFMLVPDEQLGWYLKKVYG